MSRTKEKKTSIANASEVKVIARWKRGVQQLAVITPQIEDAKRTLLATVTKDGTSAMTSKHGIIQCQTRATLDVGELKRRLVDGKHIDLATLDKLVEECTRQSSAFLVAPREWGAEVRTAAELESAA